MALSPSILALLSATICLLSIWTPTSEAKNLAAIKYKSKCLTIPWTIHITKDEYDNNKVLVRTCEENVAVNKCEGACASSIQPSALNSAGFQKECHCCRESSYRERKIKLTNCFDADGVRLTGALGSMAVKVNEPMDCQCHECGTKLNY